MIDLQLADLRSLYLFLCVIAIGIYIFVKFGHERFQKIKNCLMVLLIMIAVILLWLVFAISKEMIQLTMIGFGM